MANNYDKNKLRLDICYSLFTDSISYHDMCVRKYMCKTPIMYVYCFKLICLQKVAVYFYTLM